MTETKKKKNTIQNYVTIISKQIGEKFIKKTIFYGSKGLIKIYKNRTEFTKIILMFQGN